MNSSSSSSSMVPTPSSGNFMVPSSTTEKVYTDVEKTRPQHKHPNRGIRLTSSTISGHDKTPSTTLSERRRKQYHRSTLLDDNNNNIIIDKDNKSERDIIRDTILHDIVRQNQPSLVVKDDFVQQQIHHTMRRIEERIQNDRYERSLIRNAKYTISHYDINDHEDKNNNNGERTNRKPVVTTSKKKSTKTTSSADIRKSPSVRNSTMSTLPCCCIDEEEEVDSLSFESSPISPFTKRKYDDEDDVDAFPSDNQTEVMGNLARPQLGLPMMSTDFSQHDDNNNRCTNNNNNRTLDTYGRSAHHCHPKKYNNEDEQYHYIVGPQNVLSCQEKEDGDDGSAMGDSVMALPDYDVEGTSTRMVMGKGTATTTTTTAAMSLSTITIGPATTSLCPIRKSTDLEYGRRIKEADGLTWIDSYFDRYGGTITMRTPSSSSSSFHRNYDWTIQQQQQPGRRHIGHNYLIAVFDYKYSTMLWYQLKLKVWTQLVPITVAMWTLIVLFTIPGIYNTSMVDNSDVHVLRLIRVTLLTVTSVWSFVMLCGYYRIYHSRVCSYHVAVYTDGIRLVHDTHIDATYGGVLLAAFHVFDTLLLVPNKTDVIPFHKIGNVKIERPGRVNHTNDCAYWLCFSCLKVPYSTVHLRLLTVDDYTYDSDGGYCDYDDDDDDDDDNNNDNCDMKKNDDDLEAGRERGLPSSSSSSSTTRRNDGPNKGRLPNTLDGLQYPAKFRKLVRAMIKHNNEYGRQL